MLIKSPTIDPDRIKPLHDYVYVRRCLSAPGVKCEVKNGKKEYSQGGIGVSDYEGDSTTWGTILRVGPKCTGLTEDHVGWRAMCAPDGIGWSGGIHRIQAEEFFVKEPEIIMITAPPKGM